MTFRGVDNSHEITNISILITMRSNEMKMIGFIAVVDHGYALSVSAVTFEGVESKKENITIALQSFLLEEEEDYKDYRSDKELLEMLQGKDIDIDIARRVQAKRDSYEMLIVDSIVDGKGVGVLIHNGTTTVDEVILTEMSEVDEYLNPANYPDL